MLSAINKPPQNITVDQQLVVEKNVASKLNPEVSDIAL